MKQLVWNVIYHDLNGQRIGTFNVFLHGGFIADVKKILSGVTQKRNLRNRFVDLYLTTIGAKLNGKSLSLPGVVVVRLRTSKLMSIGRL